MVRTDLIRRLISSLILTLCLFVGAVAQDNDPSKLLTVSDRVVRGEWVRIALHLPQPDMVHRVRVLRVLEGPDADVTEEDGRQQLLRLSPSEYAFTCPVARQYIIELTYIDGGEIKYHTATCEIVDSPAPRPEPIPVPTPGKRLVLLVRETSEAAPEYTRIVNELRTRHAGYLSQKQHIVLALDKDYPAQFLSRFMSSVTTYPAVIIIDPSTDRLLGVHPMPASSDSILDLIKQYGG